jgi:hypothetical protein
LGVWSCLEFFIYTDSKAKKLLYHSIVANNTFAQMTNFHFIEGIEYQRCIQFSNNTANAKFVTTEAVAFNIVCL